MDKQNYIAEKSLGTFYRMNGEQLEWQPMVKGSEKPTESEWGAVEKDLVGHEEITFRGRIMTFNEAYEVLESELKA